MKSYAYNVKILPTLIIDVIDTDSTHDAIEAHRHRIGDISSVPPTN